jgi:trans-2-enoyl-CoA reductase
MDTSIYSIVYEAHGNPSEVLRLAQCEIPAPAADEDVVALKAAPINPADLNAIEGKYPIRPPLPATPVSKARDRDCSRRGSEKRLTRSHGHSPHDVGTWREACIVKAEHLIVLPQESTRSGGDAQNQSDDCVAYAARFCPTETARLVDPERCEFGSRSRRDSDFARTGISHGKHRPSSRVD